MNHHRIRDHPTMVRWFSGSTLPRLLILVVLVLLALMAVFGTLPAWITDAPSGLLAACLLYGLLLAIPFIPSVEIGLLIMVLYGKSGALGAYVATLLGLNLAYAVGRFLNVRKIGGDRSGLPAAIQTRLPRWLQRLPPRSLAITILALLLNLPANTIVGGGGGIAFLYAASRLLPWPVFVATVALATAPVPLLFLAGIVGTEEWLVAE